MTSGKLDIVRDVLQECGIERGGFIEGQRRYQSRFGATRRRGFGHDGHAASRGRLEGWYGGRHPVAALVLPADRNSAPCEFIKLIPALHPTPLKAT